VATTWTLGWMMSLPAEDMWLVGKLEITGRMGGRASEEIMFGVA
jgi:ATP-dependent Zn protease